MAKQRMINTKLWSDGWVRKLNPLDRYLFIYFLTNEHANIAGIYELPIETLCFESGIDRHELENSMLKRLEPKVIYREGWVILPNFVKHQNQTSPKVQRGIEIGITALPSHIKDIAIEYGYPIDTLSHSNSNPNSNSKEPSGSRRPKAANRAIDEVIGYLKAKLGVTKLDGSEVGNRRYAHLMLQKVGGNEHHAAEAIKKIIDAGLGDNFHRKNMTDLKYVYYNGMRIIAAHKLGDANGPKWRIVL